MVTKELLFSKTALPAIQKSLDAGMLRSKAIAQNIANIDVENYKRIEVRFEDYLRRALDETKLKGKKTNSGHLDMGKSNIPKIKPKTYRPEDNSLSSGKNNVDIDIEASKMAENQILFNYGVKFSNNRFRAINKSIKGSAR